MNRNQFNDRLRNLALEKEELDRKWRMYLREQEELMILEAQSRARSAAAASSSSSTGGGGGLTPFILQKWGFNDNIWSLYRLSSSGTRILIENTPPLEGPTVITKNTQNGLYYYITYNSSTSIANFGVWDSSTGEWQFLEEGTPLLRNLVPASLQYIEGNEFDGNFFIYTDNNQYVNIGSEPESIGAKTFRIDLDTPTSFEMTELHEWEAPSEIGSFPISTFYGIPVAVGASPSPSLYQVQQASNFPLSFLSSIDGDSYERTEIGLMTLEDESSEALKVGFILDRTDYEGETYFNVFAIDKITGMPQQMIAKFNPIDPTNLITIHKYNWDLDPFIALTTI